VLKEARTYGTFYRYKAVLYRDMFFEEIKAADFYKKPIRYSCR